MKKQTKVLVVDDQELVRAGFALIVERAGMLVVGQARDGMEAVSTAAATKPDVVLMDIRMPGLDGIEATKRIVTAQPQVRVVALTTSTSTSTSTQPSGPALRASCSKTSHPRTWSKQSPWPLAVTL